MRTRGNGLILPLNEFNLHDEVKQREQLLRRHRVRGTSSLHQHCIYANWIIFRMNFISHLNIPFFHWLCGSVCFFVCRFGKGGCVAAHRIFYLHGRLPKFKLSPLGIHSSWLVAMATVGANTHVIFGASSVPFKLKSEAASETRSKKKRKNFIWFISLDTTTVDSRPMKRRKIHWHTYLLTARQIEKMNVNRQRRCRRSTTNKQTEKIVTRRESKYFIIKSVHTSKVR